ncbi:Mediator of RNA polymerase II transcription subunit 7 [Terramyces sp. JEL0728]|nr:Mediator of RNA polymerase II transcription subunit 7 [Terramyces sp. JEL0728]
MATELSTAFPFPPTYYENYTDENIEKFNKEKESGNITLNLEPPEPPEGPFIQFGEQDNIKIQLPDVKEIGIQCSDSAGLSRSDHLKMLNKSLLLNFVEMLDLLVTDTANANYKVEHLRSLFVEFHHLLNEYRPHQGRETLMMIMKEQIEHKRTVTKEIRDQILAIKNTIETYKEQCE